MCRRSPPTRTKSFDLLRLALSEAALRPGCGRARARADHRRTQVRRERPREGCLARLGSPCLPGSSLRPSDQGHQGVDRRHHARRPERLRPPRLRPRQARDLGGWRHRRRDARPHARPCVRRIARNTPRSRRSPTPMPPFGPTREIIEMEVPQSVAQFGHRGLRRARTTISSPPISSTTSSAAAASPRV